MASSALFKTELLTLSRSWVLRGWVIALGLTEFFVLTGTMLGNRVRAVPASAVLSAHLNGFLLVWSLVIIVLGAGSVSLESDMIADGILSRACTRTQYIAAKLMARALVVLGVFLLSSAVAGVCAWRYTANDMTIGTMGTGILIVGLAVLLLLSLGIALSVIANNTVFAIVGALLLWYVASPIFSFMGADYLSPTSLVQSLPRILKDPEAPQVVQSVATATSLTIIFSKDLDAQKAEDVGNYILEAGSGQQAAPLTAVYDRSRNSVILGGLNLPPGDTVKVTVRNVTDAGGSEIGAAGDSITTTVPPSLPGAAAAVPGAAVAKHAVVPPPPVGARTISPAADRVPPRVLQCVATATSVKVLFSSDMDPVDAETLGNYIIENPSGKTLQARAATYNAGSHTVLLSGLHVSTNDPVKVTVTNARDRNGVSIPKRSNSATYSEVTTWKYVLGFGLPTIGAFLLATVWFSRRDL
jgi:ABC-type transport system involved in multi-copper enzyme maturation permease subunit